MFAVEIYAAVRRFVFIEGKSRREAARVFGLSRDTIAKMCRYSGRLLHNVCLQHMFVASFSQADPDRTFAAAPVLQRSMYAFLVCGRLIVCELTETIVPRRPNSTGLLPQRTHCYVCWPVDLATRRRA